MVLEKWSCFDQELLLKYYNILELHEQDFKMDLNYTGQSSLDVSTTKAKVHTGTCTLKLHASEQIIFDKWFDHGDTPNKILFRKLCIWITLSRINKSWIIMRFWETPHLLLP